MYNFQYKCFFGHSFVSHLSTEYIRIFVRVIFLTRLYSDIRLCQNFYECHTLKWSSVYSWFHYAPEGWYVTATKKLFWNVFCLLIFSPFVIFERNIFRKWKGGKHKPIVSFGKDNFLFWRFHLRWPFGPEVAHLSFVLSHPAVSHIKSNIHIWNDDMMRIESIGLFFCSKRLSYLRYLQDGSCSTYVYET